MIKSTRTAKTVVRVRRTATTINPEEFKRQLAKALEDRVVAQGVTEEDKKRKAEWFKKHVIIC